jgi:hypothetical protein
MKNRFFFGVLSLPFLKNQSHLLKIILIWPEPKRTGIGEYGVRSCGALFLGGDTNAESSLSILSHFLWCFFGGCVIALVSLARTKRVCHTSSRFPLGCVADTLTDRRIIRIGTLLRRAGADHSSDSSNDSRMSSEVPRILESRTRESTTTKKAHTKITQQPEHASSSSSQSTSVMDRALLLCALLTTTTELRVGAFRIQSHRHPFGGIRFLDGAAGIRSATNNAHRVVAATSPSSLLSSRRKDTIQLFASTNSNSQQEEEKDHGGNKPKEKQQQRKSNNNNTTSSAAGKNNAAAGSSTKKAPRSSKKNKEQLM